MKVQTGEFSSYTNNLIDELGKSKVYIWDCGPEEPAPPEEPVPPVLPITDPKYHLENLRHKRAVKRFDDELAIYDRNEREFQYWQRNVRGPVELVMWSCDARDALAHDRRAVDEGRQQKLRYYISSRNKGYEKIKNLGLPNGLTPGAGHQENLMRQFAGEKEFIEVLKKDPQFGERT
jgi:hypothetical protein